MRLSFDSIDEVKEFVKALKGTRGGKGGSDDEAPAGGQAAPAPIMPSAAFNPGGGFAAPGPGATTAPGFTAPAAASFVPPQAPPEVAALVDRLIARVNALIAVPGTTDMAKMLGWLQQQTGAQPTVSWDDIKLHFLPKLGVPQLTEMAKLMAA